ncbi:MAG: polysaccharide deacetylase family protein [Hyphomicrobiaceae bacterium]|nr:polysaccharide deacetylase family protein [Hyphomicrobiaceae bacterium]
MTRVSLATGRWLTVPAVVILAILAGVCELAAASEQAGAPACADRKGALGVSRVVEIDTAGGPRFGNMQYPEIDFLRPGEVILTFDDGPLRRHTLDVLNALERHCTKATFFMVGRMALVDPVMVQEIGRRGHTVGTHTFSHKMQGSLGWAAGEKEIELGLSAVSAALGKPVAPFFRFPYLSDPARAQAHLKSRNVSNMSIDVDSVDFRTRSGDVMVDRVMRGLASRGKGIILMHDIQRSTSAGVGRLLDELSRKGFKVVHIVPKAPVVTRKDYDDMAAKEMERYQKRGPAPLAARSVVWPMSDRALPAAEPLKASLPRTDTGSASVRQPGADAEQPTDRSGVAATAPALKPATLPDTDDENWARDVFKH